MSRTLTASDRASLVKLASSLPAGSPEKKAILASLGKSAGGYQQSKGELMYSAREGFVASLPDGNIVQIRVHASQLPEVMEGKTATVTVITPPNKDEVPPYVQSEINSVREELSAALARLSRVTKQF